ncbi:MAG TPA: hypothetical protein V6C89_18110 [Drouetiella sp.]
MNSLKHELSNWKIEQKFFYTESKRRAERLEKHTAVVYIIDGAGGSGFTPLVIRQALAGKPYRVKHFRWGTGYMRIISDLTDRKNMDRKSEELSSEIALYRDSNPEMQIYIVAKSAGTAVALNALARLPENSVDRVILMSPAVSPSFPLADSLHAVKGDVISFCSAADLLFLHVGTSIFGTADGVKGVGAGLRGFAKPSSESVAHQYSKLHEIHWEPSMIKLMHFGDHSGNSMPLFVNRYIVPLLLGNDVPH